MKINLKIDKAELDKTLSISPELTRREIKKALVGNFNEISNRARSKHRFTSRSGNLERSVQYDVSPSGLRGEIKLESGIASYGVYIHEGTGIYGPSKKPIKPKSKKVLKFVGSDGKWVSKREVKGVKPDRFLKRAVEKQKPKLQEDVTKAIKTGLNKAGLQ